MKKKFSPMICLLLITHVLGNFIMAYLWFDINVPYSMRNIIWASIHFVLSISMLCSIFLFNNPLAYKLSIVCVGIDMFISILYCGVMFFFIGPFSVIFLTWGIINIRIFNSKSVCKYFGVEDTESKE